MRTYEELAKEFSSHSVEEKQRFVNDLSIDELKILKDGIALAVTLGSFSDFWISYIDWIISQKLEEFRELKLKDLGI